MFNKRSREGYLMVDHRASPGLPSNIAAEAGYDFRQCTEGKLFETACYTCAHCNMPVPKSYYAGREHAECIKCDHFVCDRCAVLACQPDYVHLPFKKFIDISADYAAKTGQPMGSPPALLMPPSQKET
jgi:hypothetical protein